MSSANVRTPNRYDTGTNNAAGDEIDFRDVWNIIRRHRLIITASVIAAGLSAALYAWRATPLYESDTVIRIDEKQSNLPVLDVLKSLTSGSEVSTEMQVLKSRSVAEGVVDSLALEVALESPRRIPRDSLLSSVFADRGATPGEYALRQLDGRRFAISGVSSHDGPAVAIIGQPASVGGVTFTLTPAAAKFPEIEFVLTSRADALESMAKALTVTRPDREANIVIASYRSSDQHLVRDVPNLLAQRFISDRRVVQQTEARSTVKLIKEQLDTLTKQLVGAEDALKSFREKQDVVSLPDEATAQVKRMASMEADRAAMTSERDALVTLLAEVDSAARHRKPGDTSPYRRLIAFPTLLRNQAATALLTSLASDDDQRAALLIRRTMADPDVEILSQRIRDIEEQLHVVAATYAEGLTNQIAAMDISLSAFRQQLGEIPAKEIEFARLERRPSILVDLYTLLQTRLKESEIAEAVEDPSVRVVDLATVPAKPIRPKKLLLIGLGLLAGLVLGVAFAFAREHMDGTVRTREDVLSLTGIPVLGLIPRMQEQARSRYVVAASGLRERLRLGSRTAALAAPESAMMGDSGSQYGVAGGRMNGVAHRLIANSDPRAPVSEAYRTLRTNLTFARPDNPSRVLAFTSPMPGDGKSTTSANMAITLAQQGLKVLLVDADLRRGALNAAFAVNREPGLSNVLLGHQTVADAAHTVELGAGASLDLLTTGTLPPNPAELLGSSRMSALLEQLRLTYDMVIFDTPPTIVVTDAAVLGSAVDGVVLVARAAVTRSEGLTYAMDLLRNVRAPVVGIVLNAIDFKRDTRYSSTYGSYSYYYGSDERSG